MKKIFLIIIATILLSITLYSGFEKDQKLGLNNWMSCLESEILLRDIVMPGSHDAATYEGYPWDKTQDLNITDQLNIGTRYFDLRVENTNSKNLGNYENLRMYHGFIATKTTFYDVATQFKQFIDNNPSEFIILDFQHFRNEPFDEVIAVIQQVLEPNNYALDTSYDISSLTMNDIRKSKARYMISWGEYGSYLRLNNNCLFNRLDIINSPYFEEYHKADDNTLINEGFSTYFNISDERLFVLQSQKTGSISDISTLIPLHNEASFAPLIKQVILNIKNQKRLEQTNIIMRDFLNKEKTTDIISLNIHKNNIKNNKTKLFNQLLTQ